MKVFLGRVSASRADWLVFCILFALTKFVIFTDADASLKAASSVIDIYRECRRDLKPGQDEGAAQMEAERLSPESPRLVRACVQLFA